jgi:hypothetical protein
MLFPLQYVYIIQSRHGSPNLDVLGKFGQMKAMAREDSDNNKVQMAIGPLTITPAGLTVPSSAFGKKL